MRGRPTAPKIIPRLLSGRKCGGVVESCLLCWFRILAKLWASTITHPCVCGRWGRRVLAPTLCDRHRASLHVYERSVGFASLRNFGRSFYKASMPYPQVAGSPSRRTKNNTPLVERGIIFGADGGGRTRTVLLPTDFESVTSANSITSAY